MMGMLRMVPVVVGGLLLTLMPGCDADVPRPVLIQMSPSSTIPAQEIPVTITGENFRVAVRSSLDGESGGVVDDTFAAQLGAMPLDSVVLVDETTLRATVPAGMDPGEYPLSITDPNGQVAELPAAFVVCGRSQADDCWLLPECEYRISLTFDRVVSTEDLLDMPVLVRLTPERVDYDQIAADGADLRFLDPEGAVSLDHEIERWEEGGESNIWVRVPQIDRDTGTDRIWMYHGCSSEGPYNPQGVWGPPYRGVWHFSGTPDDSTAGSHHGAPSNAQEIDDSGQTVVAGATQFTGQPNSYISVADDPDLAVLDDLTLSVWLNYDSLTAGAYRNAILTRGGSPGNPPATGNYPYWLNIESGGRLRAYWEFDDNGFVDIVSATPANSSPGTWYHVVAVRDSSAKDVTFYLDGAPLGEPVAYDDHPTDGLEGILYFGRSARSPDYEFAGRLDEMRIVATARSAAWVAAQYATTLDNFISYGSPESKP